VRCQRRALGLEPETAYFNAGVMVVDLDAWRREQVEEHALDSIATRRRCSSTSRKL
jgi:lipopolysaccharide biosynthesis glycosyltransferase